MLSRSAERLSRETTPGVFGDETHCFSGSGDTVARISIRQQSVVEASKRFPVESLCEWPTRHVQEFVDGEVLSHALGRIREVRNLAYRPE